MSWIHLRKGRWVDVRIPVPALDFDATGRRSKSIKSTCRMSDRQIRLTMTMLKVVCRTVRVTKSLLCPTPKLELTHVGEKTRPVPKHVRIIRMYQLRLEELPDYPVHYTQAFCWSKSLHQSICCKLHAIHSQFAHVQINRRPSLFLVLHSLMFPCLSCLLFFANTVVLSNGNRFPNLQNCQCTTWFWVGLSGYYRIGYSAATQMIWQLLGIWYIDVHLGWKNLLHYSSILDRFANRISQPKIKWCDVVETRSVAVSRKL
jgi:hypothetical protein